MSLMTKTLGTATVALGVMAGIAAARTLKTNGTNIEPDRKEVTWDGQKSIVSNTANGAGAIAYNTAQATIEAADKATECENTIPLGTAAALAGLGFVGAKVVEKKRNQVKPEQAKQAEELRKEKAMTTPQLDSINRGLINLGRGYNEFRFDRALLKFGVPRGAKPFKKHGTDENGKPVLGQDYVEYYKSKYGKTIKAGVKYSRCVSEGIDNVYFTSRFVRPLENEVRNVRALTNIEQLKRMLGFRSYIDNAPTFSLETVVITPEDKLNSGTLRA